VKQISIVNRLFIVIATSFLFMQLASAAVFEIQRVASTDSLNLRAQPGARNAIVGRIPHNGKWIRTDGKRVAVGQTIWINITWQGKTGWVNEHFIRPMQTANAPVQPQAVRPAVQAPRAPVINAATLNKKGAWVLECGHRSPFWRVIVHPGKALEVNLRGKDSGILPLTYQKQDKNKWNTAMKTVVKSSNGRFAADMTIHYTKQCHHTLANQNVRYRVKALINNEELQGCCRAVQLR
jgi:uncharacterized protein YraI